MGKKTTASKAAPSGASKRAKTGGSSSATAPPVRAPAARGNRPTPPHVLNKYAIQFNDAEHTARYDSVATRRIIEPKYMDVDMLRSIGLWDSVHELLEVAGWTEFMTLAKPVYERLCWEFLSSLKVDWETPYQNQPVHIQFRFLNRLFEANLAEFDRRLHLPHAGVWTVGHKDFNVQDFWCEITCDKRTPVHDNHGFTIPYSASGSKATSICNPTLRYLHRVIANTIFPRHESQGRARLSEVFLLWCILKDENFDTGAFMLHQLLSQASSPKSPIACGGLITAIACAWGLEAHLTTMDPLFLGGRLNLPTCIQMEMFQMKGGRVFVNHHGHALFPLPNPAKTSCADASNWVYDDDIDEESDEEHAQPHGEAIGGSGGGGGQEDLAGGSGAVPPEEEMHEPPLTRHRAESSSGFNEAHFYQYMDEHFSRLHLRLDAIEGRQQQAAHDQRELLRQQAEFTRQQRNLEHHVYYAYEHHGWPYPPPDWRPNGPPRPY